MVLLAGCIIVKDNKVLMCREGKKSCFNQWNFPSGHVENGENIIDGAIRETYEETGLKVKLTGLFPITQIYAGTETHVLFRFKAEVIGGEIKVDKKEILEAKWIDLDDLKKMSNKEIRAYHVNYKVIEEIENNKVYPLDILDSNMYGID